MAAALRPEDPDLEALCARSARGGRGAFFPVVEYLERHLGACARVGGDGPIDAEAIRFRHDSSLAFAASDVSQIRAVEIAGRALVEVVTTFLGLSGAVSPLPSYFVEEIEQEEDGVTRELLDIFHHRVLSLFYRAVKRYDFPAAFDREGPDPWTARALALLGYDVTAGKASLPLPLWQLLHLAPMLAGRRCSSARLTSVLGEVLRPFLGTGEVTIIQFVGSWVPTDPRQRLQLGKANSTLGVDTLVGSRMYDRTGKFRIQLGPLTRGDYERFQHDAGLRDLIVRTARLLAPAQLEFDLELMLGAARGFGMRLSARAPSRLGSNTFLGSPGRARIVIDLATQSESAAPPQEGKTDAF